MATAYNLVNQNTPTVSSTTRLSLYQGGGIGHLYLGGMITNPAYATGGVGCRVVCDQPAPTVAAAVQTQAQYHALYGSYPVVSQTYPSPQSTGYFDLINQPM